jgi:hypothetical protein
MDSIFSQYGLKIDFYDEFIWRLKPDESTCDLGDDFQYNQHQVGPTIQQWSEADQEVLSETPNVPEDPNYIAFSDNPTACPFTTMSVRNHSTNGTVSDSNGFTHPNFSNIANFSDIKPGEAKAFNVAGTSVWNFTIGVTQPYTNAQQERLPWYQDGTAYSPIRIRTEDSLYFLHIYSVGQYGPADAIKTVFNTADNGFGFPAALVVEDNDPPPASNVRINNPDGVPNTTFAVYENGHTSIYDNPPFYQNIYAYDPANLLEFDRYFGMTNPSALVGLGGLALNDDIWMSVNGSPYVHRTGGNYDQPIFQDISFPIVIEVRATEPV